MSEDLFDYTETKITKDAKIIFTNYGDIPADVFEAVRGLEENIETYVNLDLIRDAETCEQIIVALYAHMEEEGYIDPDEEDEELPVMVVSVNKLSIGSQRTFLVTLASTAEGEGEYEYDDEGDDADDDEKTWD
ncbi:MAG: hypothetical protein ACRC6V_01415 [Bacteroidales bacterium]